MSAPAKSPFSLSPSPLYSRPDPMVVGPVVSPLKATRETPVKSSVARPVKTARKPPAKSAGGEKSFYVAAPVLPRLPVSPGVGRSFASVAVSPPPKKAPRAMASVPLLDHQSSSKPTSSKNPRRADRSILDFFKKIDPRTKDGEDLLLSKDGPDVRGRKFDVMPLRKPLAPRNANASMKTGGAAGFSAAGEQLGQPSKRSRKPSTDARLVDMDVAPILQPVSLGSYLSEEEEEELRHPTRRRRSKGKGRAIHSPSAVASLLTAQLLETLVPMSFVIEDEEPAYFIVKDDVLDLLAVEECQTQLYSSILEQPTIVPPIVDIRRSQIPYLPLTCLNA